MGSGIAERFGQGSQDPTSRFSRGAEGTGNLSNRYGMQNALNDGATYLRNGGGSTPFQQQIAQRLYQGQPPGQPPSPFGQGGAQGLYDRYQGMQPGADRDALIRQMQGTDNGAAFNNAMRQGGNMLSGGPNGQYSYQGGHQAAPGGAPASPNPHGNTNPYTPGGVTDQVRAAQGMGAWGVGAPSQGYGYNPQRPYQPQNANLNSKGGANPSPYQQGANDWQTRVNRANDSAMTQGKGGGNVFNSQRPMANNTIYDGPMPRGGTMPQPQLH